MELKICNLQRYMVDGEMRFVFHDIITGKRLDIKSLVPTYTTADVFDLCRNAMEAVADKVQVYTNIMYFLGEFEETDDSFIFLFDTESKICGSGDNYMVCYLEMLEDTLVVMKDVHTDKFVGVNFDENSKLTHYDVGRLLTFMAHDYPNVFDKNNGTDYIIVKGNMATIDDEYISFSSDDALAISPNDLWFDSLMMMFQSLPGEEDYLS